MCIRDRVRALEPDGRADFIRGVDTRHPTVPTHFTWRGLGVLSLFTSEWDVVALSDDKRWAVIYFSATIATPEGVDLISRTPALNQADVSEALTLIRSDPFLASRAQNLFHVSHGGQKASFSLEPWAQGVSGP